MKKLIFSALALVSLAIPIAVCAQQPPIIDRQLFFGEVQIAGAQISPDGQYRQSGLGRLNGVAAIDDFIEYKHITLSTAD